MSRSIRRARRRTLGIAVAFSVAAGSAALAAPAAAQQTRPLGTPAPEPPAGTPLGTPAPESPLGTPAPESPLGTPAPESPLGTPAAESPAGTTVGPPRATPPLGMPQPGAPPLGVPAPDATPLTPEQWVSRVAADRLAGDLAAMRSFRPGYPFWRHVFAIPDGSVAFGSRADGRLLVVFPTAADWTRAGRWEDPSLSALLDGHALPSRIPDRIERVAGLLEAAAGPIVHNPTRGRFLMPNVPRYGAFLSEWGRVYERFGVPAEIGLAQAIVESGLNGTVRSEARAIGFCQWLAGNWSRLDRLSPHVIEAGNQTTQAPYCAAYLTILATKYGSFVPALSEHHAGGANVGRTIMKGGWLGGADVRSQYLLGSSFALSLRGLPARDYVELYRTYGPRSFRYTELVFGNTATVVELRESVPQRPIFATRAQREISLDEVTRRSGLSADEVRRYNPALLRRVPAGANLYLPAAVSGLGRDVSFWRHPPDTAFVSALADFLALDASPDEWDGAAFESVLLEHQRRFERTRTEEGTVMAVMLAYVIDEARTRRRSGILAEFRSSARIARLFEQGVRATGSERSRPLPASPGATR